MKQEASHAWSGLRSFEVTQNESTGDWHTHVHAWVANSRSMDTRELRQVWETHLVEEDEGLARSPGSLARGVNVQRVPHRDSVEAVVGYCVKTARYALKGAKRVDDREEFDAALKGRRLVSFFGAMYKDAARLRREHGRRGS